jgi:hypothetical protein
MLYAIKFSMDVKSESQRGGLVWKYIFAFKLKLNFEHLPNSSSNLVPF